MNDPRAEVGDRCTTSSLASLSGYSVQQIRDLERLEVIPAAIRRPNGYRQFAPVHLVALRAYRRLAAAIGPVLARCTMREVRGLPYDEAIARLIALHVDIARSRDDTLAALHAIDTIVDESTRDAPALPGDSMTITELSRALGLRSSTLRFWEQQGLISPERGEATRTRSYPPDSVRDVRIVAGLRAGGYRIPAVHAIMRSLRAGGMAAGPRGAVEARDALQGRLRTIASRSDALLRAGSDLADLLTLTSTEPRLAGNR